MEWESQQRERVSTPSTPNSMSSHSTSSSRPPTFKTLQPSPSVVALSKLSDDDLRRKGMEDLIRIIRRMEHDYKSLMGEQGHMVKDVTRKMQIYLMEIRGLKENNQKVQEECQELRDLCCFLDDDRQRGRKLAREWQRFGRYTASVMRSEVAVYQDKLKELEQKQEELILQNTELKELCLYLDQERVHMTGDRDDGDGSSSGTMAGIEDGHPLDQDRQQTPTQAMTNSIPDQTVQYIRQLEDKLKSLEEERKQLAKRVERNGGDGFRQTDRNGTTNMKPEHLQDRRSDASPNNSNPVNASKPEAIVHAMKVLQVHEQLERARNEPGEDNLDEKEMAIVREMCNVVWRKLGDNNKPENTGSRTGYQAPPPQPPRQPPPYSAAVRPQSSQNQPVQQPNTAYLQNRQFQHHQHGNHPDQHSYPPPAPHQSTHHYSNQLGPPAPPTSFQNQSGPPSSSYHQTQSGPPPPPSYHQNNPPERPRQTNRTSQSPSYFLESDDPPVPPPHVPYNNPSGLQGRNNHGLPPPPPPATRNEFYHQEWRQNFLDANNPQ